MIPPRLLSIIGWPSLTPIPLRSLIGAIGVVVAALITLAGPIVYATVSYDEQAAILSFKARLNADKLARYIYAHDNLWQYQSVRLAELIELPKSDADPIRQRVVDVTGRLVLESGPEISVPSLRRQAPIMVHGTVVGHIELTTSLADLFIAIGFISLASFVVGFAAYWGFRVLPLKVLDRTLDELKIQNARFDTAVSNMPIGLVMFDSAKRLIVCNARYGEIYGLPQSLTKPGTHLREMLEYRLSLANIEGENPEEYVDRILKFVERKETSFRVVRLGDGRTINIIHHPTEEGWIGTHEDITERERLSSQIAHQNELLRAHEEQLRTQNLHLDTALENMSQGLSMFDRNSRLVLCNKRYLQIYGFSAAQAPPGTSLLQILELRIACGSYPKGAAPPIYAAELTQSIQSGTAGPRLTELNDGRFIAVTSRSMPDGAWVTTHEDVTEQRTSEARIKHMAHHDALTDLPNRILVRERLEHAIAQASQKGGRLAVLCLDLDRFKDVNDTLGHPVGDVLLRSVASRLRGCVRKLDTVARLGGDEFSVVQAEPVQPMDVTALATRIIDAVSTPHDIDGHEVVVGTSVGIAMYPEDGADADQLLKNADLALYRAKNDGRGIYRFFEKGMDERMHARRALERDLRTALIKDEFELHYQPLIDLRSNEVTGFEALLRWNQPERGRVPPVDFIPLAEETGLIVPLGEWVLRRACADAASWPPNIKVAVNLSPVQFSSSNLVAVVFNALSAAGLEAHRLELEITETVLLQDSEATLATLHKLRDLGTSISMDDFGTGYSSLSYLRSFPFDKIKIDQSFIRDINESGGQSLAIVHAVTGLGTSLGMKTTAEGVETREQLERLRSEGCTEVQGYFYSPPRPARDVLGLIRRINRNSAAVLRIVS